MATFVDEVRCRVKAGDGGHGIIAFLREKYRPNGGPCGGDGGRGGSVIFYVDTNVHTLLDFRNRPQFRAERGQHGLGSNRTGKSGNDMRVAVPPGTTVRDEETGELLGDLTETNQTLVVAQGGRGGKGNQHYASATRQAPHKAQDGGKGEERTLQLTLKLIADVGLVGFPNAGKSTLLSSLSAARPKIADYPFTTLQPKLGIVSAGEYASFVLADIPGLIEGASEGKGLGHQFLRHIERTRVLVYLVDGADPEPDLALAALRAELAAHSPALLTTPSLVALSKADLFPPGEDPPGLSRLSEKPIIISSHSRAGLDELVREIWRLVQDASHADAEV